MGEYIEVHYNCIVTYTQYISGQKLQIVLFHVRQIMLHGVRPKKAEKKQKEI